MASCTASKQPTPETVKHLPKLLELVGRTFKIRAMDFQDHGAISLREHITALLSRRDEIAVISTLACCPFLSA